MSFSIPLSHTACQTAQNYEAQQPTVQTAIPVRHMFLSLFAVNSYLETIFDVQTNFRQLERQGLSANYSGALNILAPHPRQAEGRIYLGQLICCPVLPGQQAVSIPPMEEDSHAIGYLAVRISDSDRQAEFEGFIEATCLQLFPLDRLRSMMDFPDYLAQQVQSKILELKGVLLESKTNLTRLEFWIGSSLDLMAAQSHNLITFVHESVVMPPVALQVRGRDMHLPDDPLESLELLRKPRLDRMYSLKILEKLGEQAIGNQEVIQSLVSLLSELHDVRHSQRYRDIYREIGVTLGKIDPGHPESRVREVWPNVDIFPPCCVMVTSKPMGEEMEVHIRVTPHPTSPLFPELPTGLSLSILDELGQPLDISLPQVEPLPQVAEAGQEWVDYEWTWSLGRKFEVVLSLNQTESLEPPVS